MNKIEKLFNAVENKLMQSHYSGMVGDSLNSQIFGVFGQAYRKWNEQGLGTGFMSFFHDSEILQDRGASKMAIFKALLYFNLPHDMIFVRKVIPVKGFSFSAQSSANQPCELKDLIEKQEGKNEEIGLHHDGKGDKNHGANIILMEVEPEGSRDRKSYIIGGYASHQWKANNSGTGDSTCFLFNLT